MQIITLSADHPGFHDSNYRARRDEIASLAPPPGAGHGPPRIDYTDLEHATWAEAWKQLRPLHRRWACKSIQAAQEHLGLWRSGIPQLADLAPALAASGIRFEAVAGLVDAPVFLRALADGVFLSTQYVRHHSRPCYTPEPDVIHELVGHAASLTIPDIADLSRAFGRAAVRTSSPDRLRQLERLYWFTLEFGAVLEDGVPRAVGAGLLSSVDELQSMQGVALQSWNPDQLARTPYDPTVLQPVIYAAASWSGMVGELRRWLDGSDRT